MKSGIRARRVDVVVSVGNSALNFRADLGHKCAWPFSGHVPRARHGEGFSLCETWTLYFTQEVPYDFLHSGRGRDCRSRTSPLKDASMSAWAHALVT